MSGALLSDRDVGFATEAPATPQTPVSPPSGTPVLLSDLDVGFGGATPPPSRPADMPPGLLSDGEVGFGPATLHTPGLGGPTGSPLISGFAKGFGSEPLSWSGGLSQLLSSTGMTPPNGPGTGTTMQGINQMIEPVLGAGATVAELGYRGLSGLLGAGQATVAQVGEDLGQPLAGRDFAAFAEAFPRGPSAELGVVRPPPGGLVPYRPAEAPPTASDVFARGAEGIPRQPERPVPAGPDAPFHEPTAPEATQPPPVVTPAPVQPTQPVAPEPMEPPILRPKPAQPIAPVPEPAQVSPAAQAPEPTPNANGPDSPGYVPPVAPGPPSVGGSGNAPDPAGQPGQQVVGQPSPAPGGADGAGPVAPVAPEPVPGPAPVAGQPTPEPPPGVDAATTPPPAGSGGVEPARASPDPGGPAPATEPEPGPSGNSQAGPGGVDRGPMAARNETVSTATGRKVDTQFEVVDAASLKQATGNLQNRDRQGRSSSDAQIANIAGNLDPNRLHSSPEADRGAPIVGPDHVIESGNGRVAAIRQAYAAGKGDPYRAMIQQQGHTIPPGVNEPVLIRRRTTPMDDATRQAFVREANTPATMQLSAGEEARSDAAALSPDTLGKLNPHLTGGVLAAGNRDFVRSWLSGLSEGERNRLQSDDGSGLSQDGVKRLQSAVIAKAYGDPAVVRRLTESTDDATKAISGALTDVAPLMATVRAKIEAGQLPKDLDISKQIMRAADLARVSREKGQSPNDILNSGDMFNPIDRTTGALVRAFHDPKMTRLAGRARVADILKRYAQEALKQTSTDLAGGSKLDPAQYINAAINKAAPETEAQGGLFGGTTKPEPVSSPPEPAAGDTSESAQPVAGDAGEGSGSSRSPASTPEPKSYSYTPMDVSQPTEGRVFYHGTKAPIAKLSDVDVNTYSNVGNLYGHGLYLTDHPAVAQSYAENKGRGPAGKVFAAKLKDLRLIDLDNPIPADALDSIRRSVGDDYFPDNATSLTGKQLWREMKENLREEGNTAAEVSETFHAINDGLSDLGYDGYRHEGGEIKGRDTGAHNVAILFENDLVDRQGKQAGRLLRDKFTEISHPDESKPAAVKAAEPAPTAEGVSAAADRMSELTPPGFDPTVRGNVPRTAQDTGRPSRNMRRAAEEAGVADPDAFVSLPVPVQVRRLSHALVHKYGLGEITIHPGSNPRMILDQLGDALVNLQSVAAILNAPNDVIGFGGELNLWLGPANAAEVQGALGVYVPATRTIYMPARSNSFLHEWTHALDDELVRRLSASPRVGELLSTHYPHALAGAPRGPLAAFGNLMGTIFGGDNARAALNLMSAERQALRAPTPANARALAVARQAFQASDFYTRARRAGGARGTYLSQPYELLARSHEAYGAQRIGARGGDTEFVAKPEAVYLHEADQALRSMYPHGDERAAIFAAWDRVHAELRLAALYPNGLPPDIAARNDLFGLGPEHWGQWGNPAANPAQTAALRQELNRQMTQRSRVEEALERSGLTQNTRDPGYMNWRMRKMDALRIWTHSPRGELNAIHRIVTQNAPGAAPHIRGIIDHLTTDPGSARLIPETYEEHFHRLTHRDINDYSALVERHGIATTPDSNFSPRGALRNAVSLPRMLPAEMDALHELLTTATSIRGLPDNIQEALRTHTINRLSAADRAVLDRHWDRSDAIAAPGATPRIRQFASGLRYFLDKKYYERGQAGIEVPYTESYWPRVWDEARIRSNQTAFRDAAAETKAIQSRREIGNDGEALVARFREQRQTMEAAGYQPEVDAINRAIAQARRTLQPGQTPRPEDLVPDPAHRELIHESWGREAADDWLTHVTIGHPTSFETHGPAGSHLQARTLPPEADHLLRDYLIKDPHAMIPAYASQINRRIAYTQRFGQGGRRLEEALTAAGRAGMDRDQLDTVRHLTELVTGRSHRAPGFATVREAEDMVHAMTIMSLMGRTVFTALHEPMVTLLRTQSVRATFTAFANMAREAAAGFGLPGGGEAQRIAELAHYVGVTTSSIFESIIQHRTGASYSDAVALGPLTTNFFRRNLLTGMTNAQRRGELAAGHVHLWTEAGRVLDPDASARVQREASVALTELGIPEAEQREFSRWVRNYSWRRAPDLAALQNNRMGDLWSSAIYRFVNQVNQAPTTSEKPIKASEGGTGRMVFGLMSFNYSFFTNVMDRYIREAERQFDEASGVGAKAGVAGRVVLHGLLGVAGLALASLLGTVVRESIFNGDVWDEHKRKGDLLEWLINLAMQRTGLGGTVDPLIQLYHGLRYNKTVAGLGIGIGGYWAENLQDILEATARASPHTNTSMYNAYRATYNLLAIPALSVLLTAVPGGRAVRAASTVALMKGTSRSAADAFATTMTGPKGSGDETTARQTDAEAPERDEEAEPDKKAGGAGENLLLGFVDDLLPVAGRIIQALPAPVRWGAAGIGALYGAHRLHEDAQRYTEPPPGKAER